MDTSSFVLKIEETESDEIELARLQNIMNVLANKVVRDCTYCIIRHRVSDLLPWTAEQWQKFILSVCFLPDWTELFMSASGSQPKWLRETDAALQKVDRKFPGILPRPLLGCSTSFTHSEVNCEERVYSLHGSQRDNSSTSAVKIDAKDGLNQTNSLNTGATKTNVEPTRPTSKIKRVKQRGDVDITAPDTAAQIAAFLEKATQVSQSFEVGQEIESFSKEATEILRLCSQATLVNKLFAKVVPRREIDHDAATKFAQATTTLTELICRCPSDCMGHARLKALLKQYDQICRMITSSTYSVHLAVALASDYKKLEKYWQDHFADPFKAMRNHVQLTERGIVNLEPKKLKYPLRQLICKFGDTCDVSLYEFQNNISNDRATQLRKGFKEIGLLLNAWIQRFLDANIRVQLNGKKIRRKLVRYEAKAPGSIPISLMENVERLSKNPST